MKKVLFPVMALALGAAYCGVAKKQTSALPCIQGKIIRISCASYVVQVLNRDTIGVDGWKTGPDTTRTYDNVFDVANKCKLPAGLKAGDTIYFNIRPAQGSDCVSCMMFDAPPVVKYDLTEVTSTPCQ